MLGGIGGDVGGGNPHGITVRWCSAFTRTAGVGSAADDRRRPFGERFGAAIVPVGVLFALMHSGNPNANWFGLANTAGLGILVGYAFFRPRDLWLPIGLHFGWNFTLPLFGVNLSGLRMNITGHEMVWTAGNLWSGGEYGPGASLLTSAVLFLLFVYLWKAPLRRQRSLLTDPPAESAVCEPSRRLRS
jgi:hypothetical protein